jgi:tetratricopeptide (TPR) repeat protein
MAHVVRRFGRTHQLIALISLALLRAAPIAAQTSGDYPSLVEQYATGNDTGSMAALGRWSRPLVSNAVNAWASKLTPRQLVAAATLHTELASRVIDSTPLLASFHIGTARHLIDTLNAGGGRGRERGLAVKRRWYEFVVSLYTSRALLAEAERFALDGLADFPRDAVLWVALGAMQEMRLGFDEPDLRGSLPDNGRAWTRLTKALESAGADFRRALAVDNGLAAAHLHLGWVHFILHDGRAADDLRAALAQPGDDGVRCLAHLFLGAVAERDKRLTEARQEYEAAQALGPAYQTPFIALIRVEEELGHHARARELAEAFAALPLKVEDPWWDYHLGSPDLAALAWLRHEASGQ